MRRSGCVVGSVVNDDRGPSSRRDVEPDEMDDADVETEPGPDRKLSGEVEREEVVESDAADDLLNRLLRNG